MSSRGHTQSSSRRDGFSSLYLKYLLLLLLLLLLLSLPMALCTKYPYSFSHFLRYGVIADKVHTEAIAEQSMFGMHKGTQGIHLRLRLTACDKKLF